MVTKRPFPGFTAMVAVTSVFVVSGCVRSSTFRTEVEQLRQEIQTETQAVRQESQTADSELDRRLSSRVDAVEQRMMSLENALATLEDEFGAVVDRFEQALRVHTPIHFGFDDDRIESSQLELLDRLGSVLREYYPQALITVEGFTDPAGSVAYNLALGQRRADAVREHMLLQGWLGAGQVRAVSYGKDTSRLIRPGAQGPEAGRENRRVVIVIDHPNAWTAATTTN